VKRADFSEIAPGEILEVNGGIAFSPAPLPPSIPLSWELIATISEADRALSKLAGITRNLPNPHLLINPFVRREALLSSQIEGTQTSLSELFYFEAAPQAPANADVEEVLNYVNALEFGLQSLTMRNLSLTLLKEMHALLMRGVRGQNRSPGQFRTNQNWIAPHGTPLDRATYVPPPPLIMQNALEELERFLHQASPLHPLVRIALTHYQFEAIHPFEDGNGRTGRLLISLQLCSEGLLPRPLLYLSAYFERHRRDYTDLLLAVSQRGAWREWIEFFLRGITVQSEDAVQRSDRLLSLWADYRARVQQTGTSSVALRMLDELFSIPVMTANRAVALLHVTPRAAQQNIDKLTQLGILRETTGRQRNRIYNAGEILAILNAPEMENGTSSSP
jgi:Fic family protein